MPRPGADFLSRPALLKKPRKVLRCISWFGVGEVRDGVGRVTVDVRSHRVVLGGRYTYEPV